MLETITIISVIALAIFGVPLFIVIGLLGLFAFHFAGIDVSAMAVEIYRISSTPTLLTIPLFTFAGYMMAESGSPKRLLNLAEEALGWIPGGVAIVSLVVCAFFTAFSGASGVTIIALGGLLYPILRNEGYSSRFSMGLITSSGSLGLLFPPSLPLILYGIVARVDIEQLFRAGILPGTLLIVILSIWSVRTQRAQKQERKRVRFSPGRFWRALKGAFFETLLPIGVVGSIYSGLTTIPEAAAFTAFYVFIMECFIYKDLKIVRDIPRVIADSMSLVGAILLILCCALGVTNYLVDKEVPVRILEFTSGFLTNKYAFLMFLNVFLLVVGSMMDIFSAIIIVVPLIVPLATEFGVHPIHLAIVFLTNLEIGYITPPVGINLFISSFRFKRQIIDVYKASFPFLLLMLIALLIITYVPSLSLFLVDK